MEKDKILEKQKEVLLDLALFQETAERLRVDRSGSVTPAEILKVLARDVVRNICGVELFFPGMPGKVRQKALSKHFSKTVIVLSLIVDNLDKIAACKTPKDLQNCLLGIVEHYFADDSWGRAAVETLEVYEDVKRDALFSGEVEELPVAGVLKDGTVIAPDTSYGPSSKIH